MFIEVDRVKKAYGQGEGRVEVLKGLSFSLERGQLAAIFGPSGSGKSTILNAVGGLERIDGGRIAVGGSELARMNSQELARYRRATLGFVFQFYNLVPNLTVLENVQTCEYLARDPIPARELVEKLGLGDHARKFPSQLSGGQQQRCAIARALAKNPSLLLCDEPTGALDFKNSIDILVLLESVNREFGTTMLIVTHNEAIKRMVHKVIQIHDGTVVEEYVNEERAAASGLTW